jgi:hypothetical protein
MSCVHDCRAAPAFPAAIENRPALGRIGYRIGDYARCRAHLLALLDQTRDLGAWTHRGADDPGIALLECGAIVAELVAFYQELYANEAYLRSALWRQSVARLVALGGYRLAPGLGGQASFALAVKGNDPVVVPAGFGFKADLEQADAPAIFESLGETTAYPWLSSFKLYRPRRAPSAIAAGASRLELAAVDGLTDLTSRQAEPLKAGDRLILVPGRNPWEAGGGSFQPQPRAEILIVKAVRTVLDRILVDLDGKLAASRGIEVDAYRVERSFRHFGHNAPARTGTLNEDTGIMNFAATRFVRPADGRFPDALPGAATIERDFYSTLDQREFPLDTEVDDLAVGGRLVITAEVAFDAQTTKSAPTGGRSVGAPFGTPPSGAPGLGRSLPGFGARHPPAALTVVREIADLHQDTLLWGGQVGGASVVTLTEELVTNPEITGETLDIRRVALHEVVSPRLTLRAESRWADGAFGLDTALSFFGRYGEALALAGRELLLEDDHGLLQPVRVTSAAAAFDLGGRDESNPWLWPVQLDQPPQFPREAFAEEDNQVTVYGNLAHTDQGETQAEAALGNGDARQAFQTFALPKAPLTYLLDSARTPPQVAALEVYIDGLRWERVDTFFDSGPKDRVYVLREDEEGNSLVQFGDGKTGARLPSGLGNVRARFRVGTGAYGPLQAGKAPKALGRLAPLSKLWMPQPATGGAAAETEDSARAAAPARLQSLGRLVGLADYEAETLALPGVRKVRASWVAPAGSARLRLVVLTDGASATEAQAVAAAMAAANRCRGAGRFTVETVQGLRQYVYVDLSVGYAAERLAGDIELAVRAALGVEEGPDEPQDGLFGLRNRQFGQGAHVSQVLAVVQQASGVVWVRVDAFQPIALGDPPQTDPLALAVPATPVRQEAVVPAGDALLALHLRHLALNLARETAAVECSA